MALLGAVAIEQCPVGPSIDLNGLQIPFVHWWSPNMGALKAYRSEDDYFIGTPGQNADIVMQFAGQTKWNPGATEVYFGLNGKVLTAGTYQYLLNLDSMLLLHTNPGRPYISAIDTSFGTLVLNEEFHIDIQITLATGRVRLWKNDVELPEKAIAGGLLSLMQSGWFNIEPSCNVAAGATKIGWRDFYFGDNISMPNNTLNSRLGRQVVMPVDIVSVEGEDWTSSSGRTLLEDVTDDPLADTYIQSTTDRNPLTFQLDEPVIGQDDRISALIVAGKISNTAGVSTDGELTTGLDNQEFSGDVVIPNTPTNLFMTSVSTLPGKSRIEKQDLAAATFTLSSE